MQVTSVTIAAPDPRVLAEFYADLLGWPVTASEPPRPGQPPADGWAQLRPPTGSHGPTLNLEYEPDFVPAVWPSEPGEQQLQAHLDILVEGTAVKDLEAGVEWAENVGATRAAFQPQERVRVMLDPAGHPFCLFLEA